MHSPLDTLHLLRPWWLLLLAAAAAIFWLDRTRRRDEAGWRKIVSPALLAWLMVTSGKAPWIRPGPAAALLLALAAIPLSGPAWRREPSPFVADRAAMMVSLDVSRAAAPTLDAAKRKIRDLVGARGGARTGLVAYAGTAHLVLPPATDAGLIETYLDALLPDVMPRDGRDITAALTTSLRQLDSSDGAGTVVLVTGAIPARDGDAFAGAIAGSRHAVIVLPPAPVPREALSGARGAVIVPSTADQTDIATVMTHAEQHFAAVAQDDPALR
jgi:Ca-activated chloride channel homolog